MYALVYRANSPYPIRHVIKTEANIELRLFLQHYYETFTAYEDDTVEFFNTLDEAYARERELYTEAKEAGLIK